MGVREDLLAAGIDIVEREGLHALTSRRVAKAAGVSHGAPRHHFASHAELLAGIARMGIADLDRTLTPALQSPDPEDAIRAAANAYLLFARSRPGMFALITRHDLLEGAGGNLRELTSPWVSHLVTRLAEARGHADIADALALWAGIHGLAALQGQRAFDPVTAAPLDPRVVVDRVIASALTRP